MKEKTFYQAILDREIKPILNEYMQERKLSELAKMLGIKHRSRLTELKNGQRELTFFWLNIFVKGGVMSVDRILRGRNLSDLEDIELDTVLRLDPDKDELILLYKAKRQGIDIKSMLKSIIKD
jgi:hypothetical protein